VVANFDYEAPTWSQIYDMLFSQAQKIQDQQFQPDIIIGIAKGGVIPARLLSDLLETAQLSTIEIEFYKDIAQPMLEPTLKKPISTSIKGKKTLAVDDIADTGKSLKLAQTYLQEQGALEIKIATLYFKPSEQNKT
jgi:hypoxanthine phosphoribosyltransferase